MIKVNKKMLHDKITLIKFLPLIAATTYILSYLIWTIFLSRSFVIMASGLSGDFLSSLIKTVLPVAITACFIYIAVYKCIEVVMKFNIPEQNDAQEKLALSYQELEAVYEELAATEEELKEKYQELQMKEQELEISEERYRLALEGSRDAIWDWDIKRNKSFVSERWREMLGYEAGELEVNHLTWKELIHPDDRERSFQAQQDHLKGKTDFYTSEYRLKMKNGDYKWIMVRGKALRDADGKPIRIAGSQTDITGRKNSEEKINFMAYYDSLTGLPNRVFFQKLLSESMCKLSKDEGRGAVLFLDLDNFKAVNDTFGHSTGDDLLKSIAGLLRTFETENVKISRFGGDEFAIMVHDLKDDIQATDLASNIVKAFKKPWQINEREFYNTVSLGIVFYPYPECDIQNILSNADCAMYSVKEDGKDNYKVYSDRMNSRFMERINMEGYLRHALERQEFVIHYQPQVSLHTGEITGVEALVRWNHPTEGLIYPGEFIPLAEETGLIVSIGEWVLQEACKQNKVWQDMGFDKFAISVNLSACQLRQPDLVDKIRNILVESGLEPRWLDLEITESSTISDIDSAIKVLKDLNEIGVNIVLDDFGTGYCSLSYLKQLPISTIKIDKSFLNEINEKTHEAAVAETVIVLAHKMGMKVIAEGVETRSQREFLRHKNCDMMQGYLFSKPLPVDDVEKYIEKGELSINA